MGKPPQRSGVYCRLSYAEDGSEEKVDRQDADCRQLADRLGWPISERHVYKDNNRSAWQRNRKRPGWDSMLTAIENNEIDSLIVYHGDRLIRQPYDLEKLINVADSKGIRIASVTGTRDLDNPDDRYILRIEAAGFCRSSDDTSRRVTKALEAKQARGLPRPGARRPFGFERDNHTIKPSEAALIVEAAERILAGQTLYGVVAWLNSDQGAPTTTGRRWEPRVFTLMIRRPRIVGLLESKGQVVGKAAWDPILDVETWTDVKQALDAISVKHPNWTNKLKYVLSGVATCGTCGDWLRVGKSRKVPHYKCINPVCTYQVGRSMEHLDAYVEGMTVGILNDPDFIKSLHVADMEPGLITEISQLERRKAEASEQLENLADYPQVHVESLMKGIASFDRKLEELRARRASTARQRQLLRMAGVTREEWAAEPVDVRRSTIAAIFRVVVLPNPKRGPGFDPNHVRVVPVDQ